MIIGFLIDFSLSRQFWATYLAELILVSGLILWAPPSFERKRYLGVASMAALGWLVTSAVLGTSFDLPRATTGCIVAIGLPPAIPIALSLVAIHRTSLAGHAPHERRIAGALGAGVGVALIGPTFFFTGLGTCDAI